MSREVQKAVEAKVRKTEVVKIKRRRRKKKEKEKKQKENNQKRKKKKKKPKKERIIEVKKVTEEWEIWDKQKKVAKSEEEVKKLVPEYLYQ